MRWLHVRCSFRLIAALWCNTYMKESEAAVGETMGEITRSATDHLAESDETEHAADHSTAVLMVMLTAIVLLVCAVVIFGYAAIIIYALAATATMLVTLVVLTAGR